MYELKFFPHIRAYIPEYTKLFECPKEAGAEAARLCAERKPAAVYRDTGELVFRGYPNPYNRREKDEVDTWDHPEVLK